jgi:hypothetical protein
MKGKFERSMSLDFGQLESSLAGSDSPRLQRSGSQSTLSASNQIGSRSPRLGERCVHPLR